VKRAANAGAQCWCFYARMYILVDVTCECSGEQTRRHLFLAALRAHGRQADGRHLGSQELEKDGRRRTLRYTAAVFQHIFNIEG